MIAGCRRLRAEEACPERFACPLGGAESRGARPRRRRAPALSGPGERRAGSARPGPTAPRRGRRAPGRRVPRPRARRRVRHAALRLRRRHAACAGPCLRRADRAASRRRLRGVRRQGLRDRRRAAAAGRVGLGVDVSSAGELAAALAAGVDPERIVLHGNAKTDADIEAAVAAGCVCRVWTGSRRRCGSRGRRAPRAPQAVALRVTPGIEAGAHRGDPDRRRPTRSSGSRPAQRPPSRAACSTSRAWAGRACTCTSARRSPTRRRSSQVVGWLAEFCQRDGARPSAARPRRRARHRLRGRARRPTRRGTRRRSRRPLASRSPRRRSCSSRAARSPGPRASRCTRCRPQARERRHALGGDRRRHVGQPAPAAVRRALHRRRGDRMDDAPSETVASPGRTASRATCWCAASRCRRCSRGDLLAVAATGAYTPVDGVDLQPASRAPRPCSSRPGAACS